MHIVLIFFHLAESKHLQLCNVDLEAALRGFSPASLRNVQLHKAGDGSWKDVGGLKHVRQTLVETLQWPAKVRQEGREERGCVGVCVVFLLDGSIRERRRVVISKT